jgi:hypothetical protein
MRSLKGLQSPLTPDQRNVPTIASRDHRLIKGPGAAHLHDMIDALAFRELKQSAASGFQANTGKKSTPRDRQ